MTGRPGHRTMEINGKSTVSYLVRTPHVPFFMLILIGLEAKNLLAFQGRRGIASVVRWNLRPIIFGVEYIRSGKLQNESFPNFSNFRLEFPPEFCSEFSPNFSRTFRASFRGRQRPEKIHQKSPPFFNAKFPGKHEKNIHKILLESRQSKNTCGACICTRVNTGRNCR